MNRLGDELEEKGETPSAPTRGDCISNAALRHIASLGKIRLVMIPTLTAPRLFRKAPNCSIQPPMKATPNRPKTNTPFANVESTVPPSKDRPNNTIMLSHIKNQPCSKFG